MHLEKKQGALQFCISWLVQNALHIAGSVCSTVQEFSPQDLRGDSSPPTAYICQNKTNEKFNKTMFCFKIYVFTTGN